MSKAAHLRALFEEKQILRIVGAHNGLGAKLIGRHSFDGIWASGLEISTAHALPDANILTMTENLEAARNINEASCLPVVCDCDTGYGNATQVMHMVKRFEAAGLAAVVIEDKRFPKTNSLIAARQELSPVEEFAGKIEAAKNAQSDPGFMVFARVEALIAGQGMAEALRRAHAYEAAGADGIVIHSKAPTADEIFSFARAFKGKVPLVAIPTTYGGVTAQELADHGFRMVIYANHGLRASIRAMEEVLQRIDQTGSTAVIEDQISTLREVFEIQGLPALKEEEKRFSKHRKIQAVIPAARDHRFQSDLKELLQDKPLCMLELGGKTVLERQTDLIRSCGVERIAVVGGYQHDKIKAPGCQLLHNPDYPAGRCAQSILVARDNLKGEALIAYSDILFDQKILEQLLASPHPITLVIDRAFGDLPPRAKALDLVVAQPQLTAPSRNLRWNPFRPISAIGQKIDSSRASHEFIGLAFLRSGGTRALVAAWDRVQHDFAGKPFYEAESVVQADLTDLLQYLLEDGFPVAGMEIGQGWSEIHSLEDARRVDNDLQRQRSLVSMDEVPSG